MALNKLLGKKDRQPLSNTTLLLTITICTFIGMYLLAMLIWGGGFLNPQQFLDLFNNNAYLIIAACGLTIVMITGGIDISVGGSFDFTRHRTCNGTRAGILHRISEDSTFHRDSCRNVLRTRHDNNCEQSSAHCKQ